MVVEVIPSTLFYIGKYFEFVLQRCVLLCDTALCIYIYIIPGHEFCVGSSYLIESYLT